MLFAHYIMNLTNSVPMLSYSFEDIEKMSKNPIYFDGGHQFTNDENYDFHIYYDIKNRDVVADKFVVVVHNSGECYIFRFLEIYNLIQKMDKTQFDLFMIERELHNFKTYDEALTFKNQVLKEDDEIKEYFTKKNRFIGYVFRW